jgi:hypothetical protein
MTRRQVFIRAAAVLALVWVIVWGVRTWAGQRRITAERVNREISSARFADWSEGGPGDSAEAARREKEIRKIADMVNRLDFQEREKNRNNRSAENFYRKLAPSEKSMFIDLTIMESMNQFMEALDAMKPAERKKFVRQGLKDIEEGRTQAEMARADALGEDLLDKIGQEGMRAYFEKSNSDTKLDLAPLMEAMNETMQGLRGNDLRPGNP